MKRIWIVIFWLLIAIFAGVAILLRHTNDSMQKNLSAESKSNMIGAFPIENSCVTVNDSVTFLIDSANDVSTITPSTLHYLIRSGIQVDSVFCPILWTDNKGRRHFTTRKYTMSLPADGNYVVEDENGNITFVWNRGNCGMLKNINFVPSADNHNVLGIDFLKYFAMEFRYMDGAIVFYTVRPEGYEPLAEIEKSSMLSDPLACNTHYYIPMSVSHHDRDFNIDTDLGTVGYKKPAKDSVHSINILKEREITTARGRHIVTTIAENEDVMLGNRQGSGTIYYYDDLGRCDYAINPFAITVQDVLVDFPGQNISMRHHFDMYGKRKEKEQ